MTTVTRDVPLLADTAAGENDLATLNTEFTVSDAVAALAGFCNAGVPLMVAVPATLTVGIVFT